LTKGGSWIAVGDSGSTLLLERRTSTPPRIGVSIMVKEKQTKRESKKAPLLSKKEKKAAKAAKAR
jgi:hypothetical protein